MVGLQHGHAVLHSDAEAILPGVAERMAEIVAGAVHHHEMAFLPVQGDALGFYQPAQGQRRAGIVRAKIKKKKTKKTMKTLQKFQQRADQSLPENSIIT